MTMDFEWNEQELFDFSNHKCIKVEKMTDTIKQLNDLLEIYSLTLSEMNEKHHKALNCLVIEMKEFIKSHDERNDCEKRMMDVRKNLISIKQSHRDEDEDEDEGDDE